MVGVDEGDEFVAVACGGDDVPAALGGVEVEAHGRAVAFADNVVAFAVAFDEVALSVGAFDAAGALGHGVVAAPEFDAVDYENVGQTGDFIYGQNPEGEEHEFVDHFVADCLVP